MTVPQTQSLAQPPDFISFLLVRNPNLHSSLSPNPTSNPKTPNTNPNLRSKKKRGFERSRQKLTHDRRGCQSTARLRVDPVTDGQIRLRSEAVRASKRHLNL
ncbi:hypothetical protein M6B38_110750 [Iris pallida]|uniref:Uncharacterized protein n=1 Tax=Iris pallida TaxID=29817 RepID=A0AAX6DZA3_IRIPA|nr:hypothetical protein M6B38_110750 [Iris pallida]